MTTQQIFSITDQVNKEIAKLTAKGYQTENWNIAGFVNQAIQYMEETGNSEAELRYDGLKFFTVSV